MNSYDTLCDSDTNEELTADDLGITDEQYADALAESAGAGETGHIRLENGRRVYGSAY